jgi:hypothetical protein
VCESIARKYEELTACPFEVVFNAPHFEKMSPSPVQDGKVRFVHHGGVTADKHTDRLILAFMELPLEYELHLVVFNYESGYGQ